MLPLLQTHRQTVPTTNFDRISNTAHGQHIPDTQLAPENGLYHDRSLPIRTIHPSRQPAGNDSYSVHPFHRAREHQLRRKTPSGTIDAGYDGSSAKLSIGEPPFKQLAVPGYHVGTLEYQALSGQPFNHSSGMMEGINILPVGAVSWQPPGYIPTPLHSSGFRDGTYQPTSQHIAAPFASVYQPIIRANEYNVRAFCPPPPTLVGGFPLGQLGWQNGPALWEYQSTQDVSSIPRAAYPFVPRAEFAANSAGSHITSTPNHLLSYTPATAITEFQSPYTINPDLYSPQSDFKDKTLSQAYRCYASLVAYLQANARVSMNREASGTDRISSKHLIFPKPPRPRREQLALNASARFTSAPNYHAHQRIFPSAEFSSIGSHNPQFTQPGTHVIFAGIDQFRAQQNVATGYFPSSDSAIDVTSLSASPMNDARSSTDILKNLCEQSHWTWVEGMLALGCLQYALGQYSDALQCFSRITALDPR